MDSWPEFLLQGSCSNQLPGAETRQALRSQQPLVMDKLLGLLMCRNQVMDKLPRALACRNKAMDKPLGALARRNKVTDNLLGPLTRRNEAIGNLLVALTRRHKVLDNLLAALARRSKVMARQGPTQAVSTAQHQLAPSLQDQFPRKECQLPQHQDEPLYR